MLSPEGEDEEFEFYLKFAKPLVLNLPDTSDRIKAATWIRYLKNDTTDPALRGEYLKLLLFVLQRRKLFGPFASIPDENQPLQKFPDEINIQDVAKNFVEVDKKVLKETLERGGYGEWPPYTTACSSDLTEYASSQKIPNFGIQAYYAISRDPLQQWDHFEKAIFPIGEDLDSAQPESVDTPSPDISCFVSADHGEPVLPASPPRPVPRIQPGEAKDKTPQKELEDVSPKMPKQPVLTIDEFNVEPRVPPTWGSNLVNVKDLSPSRQSPSKEFDIEVSDQDMLDFFNDDIDLFEADLDDPSSFLQGDGFMSPPKARPTSPLSTASSPDFTRTPETPPEYGPYPQIDIDEIYESMSKYVDDDIKIIEAKLPATTPQRSPSPKRPSELNRVAWPPMKDTRSRSQPKSIIRSPPGQTAGPGKPCPGQPCPAKQVSPASPKARSLSPDKLFDALEYLASDKDMLDFYNDTFKLPDDDPAFYLQGDQLSSPVSGVQRTSPTSSQKGASPVTSRMTDSCTDDAKRSDKEKQVKEVTTTVQEILNEINQPSTSILKTAGDLIQESAMNKSGEGLGGDSFIAPDKKDFCWLNDMSGGPGLPQGEQQDPALWDSFGWWTNDPDEIFMYSPPSPRVYGTPEQDPYAAQRERWADVDPTPPIFSKDPKIQESKAAQRIYAIEEFGMESFEEPVWTSAEQYFKYKKEPSPFLDRRQIDRKTLDPSQFPKYESPKMRQQFTDIQGAPEEENFFCTQVAPHLSNISFDEKDFAKMTKVEAILEAARHGPQHVGVHTSTPEKDEGEWADMKFIEETPPLFMLEPPFLATPPEYEPNPDINVDELEDSISKYIEEDLKIIHSKIPATTPQRSPSPKRCPMILKETPPCVPDIDVEPDPYIPSPRGVPEKYVVPPRKQVDWDTNIGSPLRFPTKDKVIIASEEELQKNNMMRKQQLKLLYEQKFDSPPRIPSPPPMPHLMDEPIPTRRLPCAIPATKLPPANWAWKTPPKLKRDPRRKKTTPPKISKGWPVSQDISMYYESPPQEFLSPSMAVSSLMFSPPEDFGKGPSPVRSPGGRPVSQVHRQYDEIDMEGLYPTEFQEFDSPELYQSPPQPESLSPGAKAWRDKVEEHEKTGFRRKTFVVRPKPGRSYRVTGSKRPSLGTLVETSPPEPDYAQLEMENEIAALEAELFSDTPVRKPRQPPPDDRSPDYERRMWLASLKLHDPVPYRKKSTYNIANKRGLIVELERHSPAPSLQTLYSPRTREFEQQQRQDQLRLMRHKAKKEVEADKEKLQAELGDCYKYNSIMFSLEDPFSMSSSYARAMLNPELDLPPSPEYVSPERPPDEPVPQANWDWKTPPKYQRAPYVPKPKVRPTGISPVKPTISHEVSMFFESPPAEILSPSMAVGPLMYSPPEGFGRGPSPVRSPGGRPLLQDYGPYDEIDMEAMYPSDVDEFGTHDLYQSPERKSLSPGAKAWRDKVEEHEKTGFRRKTFVVRPKPGRSYRVTGSKRPSLGAVVETSPPEPRAPAPDYAQLEMENEIAALEAELFRETPVRKPRQPPPDDRSPDYERRMWLASLKLHDPVPYRKKSTYNIANKRGLIVELERHSPAPSLQTLYSPRTREFEQQQRQDQLCLMRHKAKKEVEADKEKLQAELGDCYKYNSIMFSLEDPFSMSSSYARAMLNPQLDLPPSPEYVSPERPPDEPVPQANWDWKTPPKYQRAPYVPKPKVRPTGISPDRPISQDISMYFESPPKEFLSPSMAVSPLMYSPPEGFGKTPSPVRSPGGRALPQYYRQYDEVDMETMYPTNVDGFDSPELYQSPERFTPERKAERHTRKQSPGKVQADLDAEIAALEAHVFPKTPVRKSRQPPPDDISPDYQRKIWQESLKLHDYVPYKKDRTVNVHVSNKRGRNLQIKRHSRGPSLQTIYSPKSREFQQQQRQDQLRLMRHRAQTEVEADKEKLQAELGDAYKYNSIMFTLEDPFSMSSSYARAMLNPKLDLPPSPEYVSPEPPMHISDEPVPAGQPPSGWNYKTPPHMKYRPPVQRKITTPTGISPVKIPPPGTLFYESPPMMSPLPELSPPMKSPCNYRALREPSPVRSPGGRPIAPSLARATDDFDVAPYFPSGYGLDEEASPELYSSPEYEPNPSNIDEFLEQELANLEAEVFGKSPGNTRQVLSPSRTPHAAGSPPTPEPLRRAWKQDLSIRENVPYRKKTFVVKPKPGKTYRVTKSKQPNLATVEEKYFECSPISPPLKPRQYPEFQRDVSLPEMTDPPENWSWKTPSPITRRGLYTESPPLIYSPETPPESFSPTFKRLALVKTPTEESLEITVYNKPKAQSPLRSPGGRPFQHYLQERPLDALERAQVAPQDYDLLTEESPELYDYRQPSPPSPPPMPSTPAPFIAQPRRIPRQRAPLDPNVLYAATPQSAARNYRPEVERIRFEQTRPVALRPVTPPRPPKAYYETPICPGTRPWKKRRKAVDLTARRQLQAEFDTIEREFEREMMEELAQYSGGPLARDILGESPPGGNDDLDEVSMFGDFDYEPAEFNIYADDVPQYNVRPAFEGQPDVDLMDTSMMEDVDDIPYDQRDFRWMDNCGARCPWER